MTAPLVYPRTLPTDILSSRREIDAEDTYRTELVDYLKIQVFDSAIANPYTYAGSGGQDIKSLNAQRSTAGLVGNVFLYLPNGLQESYQAMYNETTLGAVGVGALGAVGSMDAKADLVKQLQETAGALKPEFLMNSVSSALGTVNSGLGAGGDIDGNALSALTTKKIFNPYQEVTFKGVSYRNHTFNFKIAPRNAQEAEEALKIFKVLRVTMHPAVSGGNEDEVNKMFGLDNKNDVTEGSDSSGKEKAADLISTKEGSTSNNARFLNIPHHYRLSVVRVKAQETERGDDLTITGKGGFLKQIHHFPTKVVLENLQLSSSPDNFMNTLRDIANNTWDYGPVAYTLTMTFKETQFLTSDMFPV
mgnify:FL=1